MKIEQTNIENVFNNYLLRNIEFLHNNKSIKSGKLLFYSLKEFYINFILQNEYNQNKVYTIPYPFEIYYNNDFFTLNYQIKDFCNGIDDIVINANLLTINKKNKFLDSKLIISPIK